MAKNKKMRTWKLTESEATSFSRTAAIKEAALQAADRAAGNYASAVVEEFENWRKVFARLGLSTLTVNATRDQIPGDAIREIPLTKHSSLRLAALSGWLHTAICNMALRAWDKIGEKRE